MIVGASARVRIVVVALALALGGCASVPTPVMPADEYDPEIYEPQAQTPPIVVRPPPRAGRRATPAWRRSRQR